MNYKYIVLGREETLMLDSLASLGFDNTHLEYLPAKPHTPLYTLLWTLNEIK